MKRRSLALAASILMLALLPGSTLAATSLDQSNDPGDYNVGGPFVLAQTFTAGMTGPLSSVDLYISMDSTTTVGVYIRATTGGLPNDSSLTSASASVGDSVGWVNFAFATPITVTSGTMYAILFNADGGSVGASLDTAYGGGQALRFEEVWVHYTDPALDFAFRTYVDTADTTPAPGNTVAGVSNAPNATPPPSSTVAGAASDTPAGTIGLLGVTLSVLLGGLFALVTLQRRRVS